MSLFKLAVKKMSDDKWTKKELKRTSKYAPALFAGGVGLAGLGVYTLLVKHATIKHDPIEHQHKLTKNIATVNGGIVGGLYGGMLASGKSKKLIEAQNTLSKAQAGHTKNPSFIKKIFGAKPTHIVDNEKVNKLLGMVKKLKRVRGVKIGLGAIGGAAIMGAGMRKMQDVQNKYEVALSKGNK